MQKIRSPCEKTCGLNGVRCARDCRAVRYSGSLQIISRAYVRYICSKGLLTFAHRNAQKGPKPGHAHRALAERSHGNPCHAPRHSKTGRSVEPAQPAARAPVLRPHATLQRHGLRHKESHVDVLRAAAHRREVLHDQADELDRPGARRVMRKDHRGPKTPRSPSAIIAVRTRLRALTRETREAAAWWARHRSNEGFLLGKSCHVSELPTRQLWNLP